jgi:hypothetical protein
LRKVRRPATTGAGPAGESRQAQAVSIMSRMCVRDFVTREYGQWVARYFPAWRRRVVARQVAEIVAAFGSRGLDEITHPEVSAWGRDLRRRSSSARARAVLIRFRHLFGTARERGYVSENPTQQRRRRGRAGTTAHRVPGLERATAPRVAPWPP